MTPVDRGEGRTQSFLGGERGKGEESAVCTCGSWEFLDVNQKSSEERSPMFFGNHLSAMWSVNGICRRCLPEPESAKFENWILP